jgi:hypothetical protein
MYDGLYHKPLRVLHRNTFRGWQNSDTKHIPLLPYDDELKIEGCMYNMSDSWTLHMQTSHINLQHITYLFKSTISHTFRYVKTSSGWVQLACISEEFTTVHVILLRTEISIYAIPAVFIYYYVIGKVKFTLEQAFKSQNGNRALLFLQPRC